VRCAVSRATKEGLRLEQEISPREFQRFFNEFSQTRQRGEAGIKGMFWL